MKNKNKVVFGDVETFVLVLDPRSRRQELVLRKSKFYWLSGNKKKGAPWRVEKSLSKSTQNQTISLRVDMVSGSQNTQDTKNAFLWMEKLTGVQ